MNKNLIHGLTRSPLCMICIVLCIAGLRIEVVYSQLVESPQITSLMDQWKTYNLEHQELTGWRIQILATVDRRQMENVKRRFENIYPEYPVHMTHNEPYFQLKTGAFLTMQKAQAFLKMLQHDYPGAIPVTDNLKMDELLLYDQ
ncbi:MAG TPA: SPOR domain-containing protein [Saprospiraceae bacterium]|nr:SPOR domain-containing protein [Saprospiraceae bacterium]